MVNFNIIKNKIIKFIFHLIQTIEDYEYKNMNLNQDDIDKKIISSYNVNNLQIMSDTGWVSVPEIHLTQPYDVYKIILSNGYFLECADNHIVFDDKYNEVFIKDLLVGNVLMTDKGVFDVVSIERKGYKLSMCDLSVDSDNHRYYTNGILSHNTISSAIFILHTILFKNDKNVMIVANKGDTAVEIIDKVKSIYTLLPFFLKPGAKIWNQKSLTFDNGCRIKISARSKTPAIGFTIDLLYLDEFAHIPSNIIEPYYTAAFPVTSAVKNSKIIITSTPNGMNLFHKLLTDAERPDGDPLKTNYKAKRVYWYQVPGRFVTYIRLNDHKMYNLGITKEEVLEQVEEYFGSITKVNMEFSNDNLKYTINVFNNDVCSEEDVINFLFIDKNGMERRLFDFAELTTWKKEAIKDIGGEDAFNQEYDLRFINASRSLLSESVIENILGGKKNYIYHDIEEMNRRLRFSYSDLKWVDDPEIYDPINRKTIKGVISIDIAEGLGQDYSIINIFKIDSKDEHIIEKYKDSYVNMSDFFCLKQIGMFRSNIVSVKQLSELFYVLLFEHFDPDNFKVVLELNNYGGEFLAHLPYVFDGHNEYGAYVFFNYKHRADAVDEKIGLKVGENKNLMVKSYQECMKRRDFVINNEDNVREITTFVKHVTTSGNIRYAGDSGNDDTVMTIVNASTVFEKNLFKEMVDDYAKYLLDSSKYGEYQQHLKMVSDYKDVSDYSSIINVNRRRRVNINSIPNKPIDWHNKRGI